MATSRRRRYAPRMPAQERRRQVLDATLALIAEHGYAGVSMEAIARAVGVAKPVVYDLFGNLGALLTELLEREEAQALAQVAAAIPVARPEDDPVSALGQGLTSFLGVVTANPQAWRLIVMPPEATPQVVRDHVERGRAQVLAQLEPLVEWGTGRLGYPGEDLDVELAAQALMTLGEHAARLALTDPVRYPPERFGDFLAVLTRALPQPG